MRLERLVSPTVIAPSPDDMAIEFDASIYGCGAVLRDSASGVAVEFVAVVWHCAEAMHLDIAPWDSAHQTFWGTLCAPAVTRRLG